jgi:hypothetical protein
MCDLVEDYYDDLFLDLDYQEWLRTKKQQQIEQMYAEFYAEQEAYTKMAEEHFKDLEQMEKYEI